MENNGLIPVNNENISRKSPWEKPGGTLGMICAGLAVGGGLFLLWHLLPIMITLASNVLYLILMLLAIGILGYILTSKKFWHTFGLAYFIIMRKITGFFIKIDPVAILEDYIKDLQKRIKEVDENVTKVRGLIKKNERRVSETKDKLDEALSKKKRYEKMGQGSFAAQTNGLIVMYEKALKERTQRLSTSKKWLEALVKLQQYATFNVGLNQEKVQLMKEEYEEIKQTGKTFRSIKSALNGDPDIMSDFEMACEIMENEITFNLGEIEGMIDETNGILSQADADNAAMSDKANLILAKYEQQEGIFSEAHWKSLPDKGNFGVNFQNSAMPEFASSPRQQSNDNSSYFD